MGIERYFTSPDCAIKMRIVRAIDTLTDSTTFKSLTISSICKEADVSRPTFYRHFTDKYEAVRWYLAFFSYEGLYQVGRTKTWHEAHLCTCQTVLNEPFSRKVALASDLERAEIFSEICAIHEETLFDTVTEYKNAKLTDELMFQIRCYVQNTRAGFNDWMTSESDWITPEKAAALLDSIVSPQLFQLLDTPCNPLSQQS